MTDGFKDKDGKFRPTIWSPKKNGIKKDSIDSSTTSNNAKYKLQEYYHFDDLSESAKERAIEHERNAMYEFQDNWFAEDEGILYDTETNFAGYDVFKDVIPKYYDVDSNRGTDYIKFDLEFKEGGEQKLMKYLGIPKSLQDKISIRFSNSHYEVNTQIAIYDVNGNNIDLGEEYEVKPSDFDKNSEGELYSGSVGNNFWQVWKEDLPTKTEYEKLQSAKEKWDDLMHESMIHLKNNYEYHYSDEAISENIEANEREFNKEGNVV